MQPHPDRVAARLGLDEATMARLRARGQLERLALTEPEIRASTALALTSPTCARKPAARKAAAGR